jgi:hypothetical protein
VLDFNIYNQSELNTALSRANYGDVLTLHGGTYSPFAVTRQGLTIDGGGATINSDGSWQGILIGASNTTVENFNVNGDADSTSMSYAQSQENNTSNPSTNGNGIDIAPWLTHVSVLNNNVSNEPGAGISSMHDDYVTIKDNQLWGNCHWSPYAASAIDVFSGWSSDGNTGQKDFVQNNDVHDNSELVPYHYAGTITDGSGIIIDSNNDTGYNGTTLISGNKTDDNGGAGINVYNSNKVDIEGNTASGNVTNAARAGYGQITLCNSNNSAITDNTASGYQPIVLAGSHSGLTEHGNNT